MKTPVLRLMPTTFVLAMAFCVSGLSTSRADNQPTTAPATAAAHLTIDQFKVRVRVSGSLHPISGASLNMEGGGRTFCAIANSAGEGTIQHVVPGDYVVSIFERGDLISTQKVAIKNDSSSIDLDVGNQIVRGVVTDEAGNPIAGANVSISSVEGPTSVHSVTTDREGVYTVEHVNPGYYRVFGTSKPAYSGRGKFVVVPRRAEATVTRCDLKFVAKN